MTIYITGDSFQKKLTAKDANRILKVAREADAGAGNLTSKQLIRAWENGHILVKNEYPANYSLYRYSTIGIGPAMYDWSLQSPQVRATQQANVWRGQKIDLKQHWFRHGVLQQAAAPGEIVPCAIDGVTFAIADSPILNTQTPSHYPGVRVALNIYASNYYGERWEPWTYQRQAGADGWVGQARLLQSARTGDPTKSPILIKLNDHNTVWKAILTYRNDTTTFDGYIFAYGSTLTLKIYDPMALMPSTLNIPAGNLSNLVVGIEITQGSDNSGSQPADKLSNIQGYIVCVNRDTSLENVQLETPPI